MDYGWTPKNEEAGHTGGAIKVWLLLSVIK